MNMVVGSAALATASALPGVAPADPSNAKTLDVESARPELREAFRSLEAAYNALKAASDAHSIPWDALGAWERKNPRPAGGRPYKKWERRYDKFIEQVGLYPAFEALEAARKKYGEAQLALGRVRALDGNELAIKSAAAVAFEGGISEKSRRHIRNETQIVSWSIGMDTILLAAGGGVDLPSVIAAPADPIFAIIDARRKAVTARKAALRAQERIERAGGYSAEAERAGDEAFEADTRTWKELLSTPPRSLPGLRAWASYLEEVRQTEPWQMEDDNKAAMTIATTLAEATRNIFMI